MVETLKNIRLGKVFEKINIKRFMGICGFWSFCFCKGFSKYNRLWDFIVKRALGSQVITKSY
jgi:hypothetical protein